MMVGNMILLPLTPLCRQARPSGLLSTHQLPARAGHDRAFSDKAWAISVIYPTLAWQVAAESTTGYGGGV